MQQSGVNAKIEVPVFFFMCSHQPQVRNKELKRQQNVDWEDSKMVARGRKQKACLLKKILERHWRYTLQEQPLRRGKTLTPPHLQPAHSISTSH
jgi:hypothetical protein